MIPKSRLVGSYRIDGRIDHIWWTKHKILAAAMDDGLKSWRIEFASGRWWRENRTARTLFCGGR